jgi:spermidine synthase
MRFGLAALATMLPSILMGGTLPVLARYAATSHPEFGPEVGRLYAWNTWGAALGTLGSTYLLMPFVGLHGTIWLACAIDFAIFLAVAVMASMPIYSPAHTESSPNPLPSQVGTSKSRGVAFFLLL